MSHYITTHDGEGKAKFSQKIPTGAVNIEVPFGSTNVLYTTDSTPVSVSTEADMDRYGKEKTEGIGGPAGRMVAENGATAVIVNIKPNSNSESSFHRTMMRKSSTTRHVADLDLTTGVNLMLLVYLDLPLPFISRLFVKFPSLVRDIFWTEILLIR